MEQEILLAVQRLLPDHRSDDAELVGNRGDVRQQVADPEAALAVLPKLPRAAEPHSIR